MGPGATSDAGPPRRPWPRAEVPETRVFRLAFRSWKPRPGGEPGPASAFGQARGSRSAAPRGAVPAPRRRQGRRGVVGGTADRLRRPGRAARPRRHRRPAAPGLRPWRGSQLRLGFPAAAGHDGSAGASALARITTSSRSSRRGCGRCSAGASALARITTSSRAPCTGTFSWPRTYGQGWLAAPGLRPWRGSQPRPRAAPGQRRGEQRRDFGPGEDHNTQITDGTPPRGCLPQLAFC